MQIGMNYVIKSYLAIIHENEIVRAVNKSDLLRNLFVEY